MLIRNRQKSNSKRGKFSKKLKKDYQLKSLSNPFFQSKKIKKNKSNNIKKLTLFALAIAFILGFIYLLFFSAFFKIKEIKINGLDRVDNETVLKFTQTELADKKYLIFSQANIILLNSNKLANEIKSEFKFSEVLIKKKYFNTLELDLFERPISFIWQSETERVYSDAKGCLIRETPVETSSNNSHYLTLLSDTGSKYLQEDDCLNLKEEYFEALLSLDSEISTIALLKAEKYILSSELNSLVLDLSNGPNIIFNTKEDLSKQVAKLLIIRQEQVEENFLSLEYIDLRFGDLIYFK